MVLLRIARNPILKTKIMKAPDLINILKVAMINNLRVLIPGAPGIGKSEIVKQIAKELNYEILILHPVVSDPVDYKGFPFVAKDGKADFVPFGNLLKMIQADKPLIVMFDDLAQAASSVQCAVMQILLERSINGVKISDHVRFVAATNRRKDNAGAGNLITPLLNRFSTIVELEADANAWCQWALKNNIAIELISFLKFRPELISTFKAEKDIKNFSSPRSLEQLSKWLSLGITNLEVWIGCVGEAFAVEFKAFYDVFKNLAGLPELVLNNPKSAPIPEKMDVVYALCAVLAKRVNDVNIDNLFIYVDRLRKEWGTVIASSIIENKPELINTKAFIDWQLKNADVI